VSGQGVPIDLGSGTHYFKLAADQGNSLDQHYYSALKLHARGGPSDLRRALMVFKFRADQVNADHQNYHEFY
jgi:TPR repeat protein